MYIPVWFLVVWLVLRVFFGIFNIIRTAKNIAKISSDIANIITPELKATIKETLVSRIRKTKK